eukprot:1093577-Rhodomonas_salina.3
MMWTGWKVREGDQSGRAGAADTASRSRRRQRRSLRGRGRSSLAQGSGCQCWTLARIRVPPCCRRGGA